MVRYFEAGKQKIEVNVVKNASDDLTNEQKEQRDQMWKDIVENKPKSFNGGVWTCLEVDAAENKVELTVGKTDYKTITWKRRNLMDGQSVGTVVLVLEEDSVIFTQRSGAVVSEPSKVSCIGGVVDTNTKIKGDFKQMVHRQAEKEFKEEVKKNKRGAMELMGVAIGPGNKAEWGYVVEASGVSIRDYDEATSIIKVPRANLVNFLEENSEALETTSGWHLKHWAERIAKTKGLDFINK